MDRYFAGCLALCLHARCRWSDFAFVELAQFDVVDVNGQPFGFVESKTRVHKTGGDEERRALAMPLVAEVHGGHKEAWGIAWKQAMHEVGIDLDKTPFGRICKATTADGQFGLRPLGSDEATNLLNAYLGFKGDSENLTTSHSLKATLLSWSARYGIDETSRVLLGHHSLKQDSLARHVEQAYERVVYHDSQHSPGKVQPRCNTIRYHDGCTGRACRASSRSHSPRCK